MGGIAVTMAKCDVCDTALVFVWIDDAQEFGGYCPECEILACQHTVLKALGKENFIQ